MDLGFRMALDLMDPEQVKLYFYGHYHERYEARLVAALLEHGGNFWDIGANIGYFTLAAAAALKGRGRVAAFEPGANAFARLKANVALNPVENIALYNLAASDRQGQAQLYLGDDAADSGASLYRLNRPQDRVETVAMVTVDGFLEQEGLARPEVMKVDVEGAELAALRGAQGLLAQAPPMLLLEMEEKNLQAAGASRAAIQEFLGSYGYRPAGLRKGRWLLLPGVEGARGRNFLWFIPDLPAHRQKAQSVPVQL
jgi:FkbM family methyltransferase